MGNREQWVYRDKKLVGKITTKSHNDGSREIVRQKAHSGVFGGRCATKVTSRTKITK